MIRIKTSYRDVDKYILVKENQLDFNVYLRLGTETILFVKAWEIKCILLFLVFESFGIESTNGVELTDNMNTPIPMEYFNVIIKTFWRSSTFCVHVTPTAK